MTAQRPPVSIADRRREREMQHELLKFHRDRADPLATSLAKKRLRVPQVDLEANPFCLERQLADSYQQLNFNKNPRFYSVSVQDDARLAQNPRNHSSFINQSADLLASSLVERRARPEFSTLPPATSYLPAVEHFATPRVISVDPSNLRLPPAESSSKGSVERGNNKADLHGLFPPGHDEYGACMASQVVTFGHRPSSAARMFDHLSNSIGSVKSPRSPSSKRASSTPVKTGMSVTELTQLLTPAKCTNASSSVKGKSSGKTTQSRKPPMSAFGQHEAFPLDEETDSELRRQEFIKGRPVREAKLERGFVNNVYNPPRELKSGQFPPPDQTTAQLIDKYRKLAVGKLPET